MAPLSPHQKIKTSNNKSTSFHYFCLLQDQDVAEVCMDLSSANVMRKHVVLFANKILKCMFAATTFECYLSAWGSTRMGGLQL
jgi:hypothetical protein